MSSSTSCYAERMSHVLRCALIGAAVLVPRLASAHTYIMEPVSRDAKLVASLDDRAYKNTEGPCGVVLGTSTPLPRTNTPTRYTPGQTITVKWQETIDHRGCFQVLLSEANDTNWKLLAQFDDPAGSPNDEITTKQIKLPDGVSCEACTLSVRQLMTGAACPPEAVAVPDTTYYSCADIRIAAGSAGDPPPPPSPGEGGDDDPGTSTPGKEDGETPSSNSSSRRFSSSPAAEGCVAGRPRSMNDAVATAGALGLIGIVLAARRRRARRP